MIEMKRRNLEEVKALGQEAAVEIMRQAGILGAGGGGFPTYFKYMDPQPHLIVNANESEPGYWADKLMHHERLEEFLEVYEALQAVFGFEQVTMCIHEKDWDWYAPYAEPGAGVHDVRCVPDKYALGEEKALIKQITDTKVPRRVEGEDGTERPGMPLDVGIIVNNSETIFNIYNALFFGHPVTTKLLSVYGEGLDRLGVYEVPVGASMTEVLRIAGVDVEGSGHLSCIDGGALPQRNGHRRTRYRRRLRPADDQRPSADREGREEPRLRRSGDAPSRGRHYVFGGQGLWGRPASRRPVSHARRGARIGGT